MKQFHAIVIGATGAVGRFLVSQLLENSRIKSVTIFVRKNIISENKKLIVHKIDFSNISEHSDKIVGDVLFSAMGTTLKDAGSRKKQYLVDYTYQYNFAKIALKNGVKNYSLVSSVGANSKSLFFYPKIKGDLENDIANLSFERIQIFRPASLIRPLDLLRKNEKILINFLIFFNKLGLLQSLKPLRVEDLAKFMIDKVFEDNTNKLTFYDLKEIVKR
ncbi:MAG: semialdehyde dehydrogenase [Flavobacteriales bacterium]|nr:semialdehyde dehydrogenase [Flavobacteriales bacterium]|tara:strand:+ start:254 stop:907 length:654 start_codon:yes stop_codon:yes gene_type:complete